MSSASRRDDLLHRVGRLSQLGGISSFVCADGRAKGTSALRVKTAKGLEFWVVPDRGMDIFEASYNGQSLCWHSPQGIVHPAYYSNRGLEWLKTFSGGLLTTCGLTTAGGPSTDDGEELGLHGSISTTPAEQVNWTETWDGDDCLFTITGVVRESSVHGPNLVLQRKLTSSLQADSIEIHDTVTNEGVRETPLMILYHFNFGYPLLTQWSQVHAPSKAVHAKDQFSQESVEQWSRFDPPVLNQKERVYFHEMQPDADGKVTVILVQDNYSPDLGIALTYDTANLPEFVQWKMTGQNHFVLGLEPSNCGTQGRAWTREHGKLRILQPGESQSFYLKLQVLDGTERLSGVMAAIKPVLG